ncbi:MAG: energy-dependent translational throttle protein EttA [Planctomycetota bacterium]
MAPQLGEMIVAVKDLAKSYGDREILRPMSFTVHRDARIGVLGANGAGKSTFLRILAGVDREHGGTVRHAPDLRIGYLPQEPELDPAKTVRENIETGLRHVRAMLEEYERLAERLGSEPDPEKLERLLQKVSTLQERIEISGGWELDHQLELAMEALRVPPGDAPVTSLSGGERRRVALCRELIAHPDLLVLDEPTNHLDASTVEWLERSIEDYRGTVIMVTHDRYFLDNVADYMVEIENGRLTIFEGSYSDYLAKKAELAELKARQEERRQRILQRELEWLNSTPAARRSKNKARIKNYHELLARAPEAVRGGVRLVIPPGPRLGNKVLRVENLSKSYGGRTLFRGLSFELAPGEILGVVGPNGTGKTTLLRIILGREHPEEGRVELGPTVELGFVDQTREDLDPARTVWEEISEGRDFIPVGDREYHVREYLSQFQFKGSAQETPVGKLSGGERNRLLLAKTLRRGANLLLLDEPTNDLDLPTLRVLEEALEEFAGSAIVVSHDRFFLDRIVNSILVFEDGGGVRKFDGNYESYFEVRRAELEKSGVALGKLRRTTYRRMRRP